MLRVLSRSRTLANRFLSTAATPEIVETSTITNEVAKKVSEEVADKSKRLFAVVYVNGRQWKVSTGDLINLEGNLPLAVGDEIKLEKVLLMGGKNFSLIGRPLLDQDTVDVSATVVEKSTKSPELEYHHLNHNQTQFVKWRSDETTVLRITNVSAKEVS